MIRQREDVRGGARIAVVTGADGFMGRHLVRRLAEDGWGVRGVDLHLPGQPDAAVEYHAVDIRDPVRMAAILDGVDTVFHLASAHLQVGAPAGWYESVNVEGVRELVGLAASAGVRRFIHASSVGIYGHVANPPADENSPKHPTSEYERTKLLGETAAIDRAAREHLPLVVLRPGWVYGPGCPRTAKLLRTIRKGRFFYAGKGTNLRHPIHISDAVEAFILAAGVEEKAIGKPFLIVGPRAVTVRELVECCARVLEVPAPRLTLPRPMIRALATGVELTFRSVGRTPPISRRSLAFFEHDNAFSGEAAARLLGFRAAVDLEEGMRSTVEELAATDFRGAPIRGRAGAGRPSGAG